METQTITPMYKLNPKVVDVENPLDTTAPIRKLKPLLKKMSQWAIGVFFVASIASFIASTIYCSNENQYCNTVTFILELITLACIICYIIFYKEYRTFKLTLLWGSIILVTCGMLLATGMLSLQPFSVDDNTAQVSIGNNSSQLRNTSTTTKFPYYFDVHAAQNLTKQFQGVENSTATESSKTNESTFIGEASYAGDGENEKSNNSSEIIRGSPVVDDGNQKNNTSFEIEEEKTTKNETVTLANHSIETVEKTPSSTNSPTSPSSLNGMDKSQNGSAGAKDYNNGDKKDTMTKDKTFNSKDDITIPNDK